MRTRGGALRSGLKGRRLRDEGRTEGLRGETTPCSVGGNA